MEIDTNSVDEALTTTRSVRLRLDLERDVDDQIIADCIDVAEQAPTGGNRSSRRWLVLRDPQQLAALAELYRASAGDWMIASRDRLAGTGHPDESMMRSAAHLAEHLAEVPAVVIPCIIGTHDGSGRPGLFDSVLQSAWSFCVALRARGLGTAWTTAVLTEHERLAELLELPRDVTPVAMLPVAWTKGTDFHRVPRAPAREIMFVDRWGRTTESGPDGGLRLEDNPGIVVERDIVARPSAVWELVSDITLPVRFSEELISVRWDDEPDGQTGTAGDGGAVDDDGGAAPHLGRRFVGSNHHERRGDWDVPCWVDVLEHKRTFGWCTSDPDQPGARWRFELDPIGDRTRLRFRLILGPGRSGLTEVIERMPDQQAPIIERRLVEHRANMERVLEGIESLVS